MELNLHTSIVVVAAILVLLIVIDGVKRMLAARAEHKRLSTQNDPIEPDEAFNLLKAELPNGGARPVSGSENEQEILASNPSPVVAEDDRPPYARALSRTAARVTTEEEKKVTTQSTAAVKQEQVSAVNSQSGKPLQKRDSYQSSAAPSSDPVPADSKEKTTAQTKSAPKPSRTAQVAEGTTASRTIQRPLVNPDVEQVPMLMESVSLGDAAQETNALMPGSDNQSEVSAARVSWPEVDDLKETATTSKPKPLDPLFDDIDALEEEPEPLRKATTTQLTENVGERLSDRPPSEEVLVIHVFSKNSSGFEQSKLLDVFKACDLRYGEMSIFHRFERANAQGNIQFSVADVVKPGAFNLNESGKSTPGVALFMSLPGPSKPLEAFDTMAEVAQVIAKNLNGTVKDEMLSVMTSQTLEHCRHRIAEFNRRQQLARPSFA